MTKYYRILLSVLFAVSPLCSVDPAVCVSLEMLSEPGAGSEPFAAGLTPIRLVSCHRSIVKMQAFDWSIICTCVNSPMVDKIPFRAESLATQITVEGSLSRVLPHMHLNRYRYHESLWFL